MYLSNSPKAWPVTAHVPDGLDEAAIDRLIAEVAVEVAGAAGPTSALIDGSAAQRRRRRIERRALTTVVRSLPTRPLITTHTPGIEDIAS